MKKLIFLSVLLISINLYSQGKTYSRTISGTENITNGSYQYTATLNFRLDDAGYGESPTSLKIGFTNVKITSINYKGNSASTLLEGVSFPVSARLQANVNGSATLKKGRASIYTNYSMTSVSDGGLDNYDFSSSFRQKIFSSFGKKVTYYVVTPSITANLSGVIINKVSDLTNKMDGEIRKKESKKREEERRKKIAKKKKEEEKRKKEVKKTSQSSNRSSNNNQSYNNTTRKVYKESAYDRKVRLAAENAKRKREFERKQLAALERSRIRNEQRIANIDRVGNNIKNAISNAFDQANKNRQRQQALETARYERRKAAEKERKRLEEIRRKEERRKKIAAEEEKKRLKREKEKRARLKRRQNYYFSNFTDHNMPFVVTKKEVYFIITISNKYDKSIRFFPITLIANKSKQLPYKNKIIADFKTKTKLKYPKTSQAFYTKSEQQKELQKLQKLAEELDINILNNINYSFKQKEFFQKTNKGATDFWGEKKKATKKKTKKKKSTFWN